METERREFLKEKIREGMLKQGDDPTDEKVDRVLHDLEALAEIFVESAVKYQ